MKSDTISDEIVQRACLAYGGRAFPQPMRRALEAVEYDIFLAHQKNNQNLKGRTDDEEPSRS